MTQVRNKSLGFTLVELMLAMTFISVLLLCIALLTMQVGSIYNKGLTTRSVNEAGQLLSSDLQRSLNTAQPAKVVLAGDSTGKRLCIGLTVYAWNYAESLSTGFNQYDGPSEPVRFVKFLSDGTDYCTAIAGVYSKIPTAASDMLDGGDVNLVMYDFVMPLGPDDQRGFPVGPSLAPDISQRIYEISLTIGSGETATIRANEGSCKPVSKIDDEYCAVNKFTFIARAGNSNE